MSDGTIDSSTPGYVFTDEEARQLKYTRIAYFALGINLGLIGHGVVSSFRSFPKDKKKWPFIVCIWGLVAGLISTLLSYASSYWVDPNVENGSAILTTLDGILILIQESFIHKC
eukprot:NODE_62_length_26495_cov_0.832853.p20 type:complete len:114 gc:universal NODE_62_length_26495_cov_0.832853:3801-4142(+)